MGLHLQTFDASVTLKCLKIMFLKNCSEEWDGKEFMEGQERYMRICNEVGVSYLARPWNSVNGSSSNSKTVHTAIQEGK